MESNAEPRRLRPLLTVLGVLASVAVVAVAARGGLSPGEPGGQGSTDVLVDLLFTLYVLLLVLGVIFFLYLLALQKRLKRDSGIQSGPFNNLVVLGIVLVGLFFANRLNGLRREPPAEEGLMPVGTGQPGEALPEPTSEEPSFAWIPAIALVGLVVVGVGAWWWAGVRRQRAHAPREQTPLGEALADVLEETIDDLHAEQDPRRAVIRAYARLERVLAAHGIPRRPADAPLEYLRRVLQDLSVSPEAVQRLTALFERAKFSQHAVGAEMKEEAIAALVTVQDELRAAEALARQERERAANLGAERARVAG